MTVKKSAALKFVFITVLIDMIGIGIIIPIVPSLIKKLIGSNITDAAWYGGWLLFAFAIMQFLFSPMIGGLSDRFGRRPILLLSLFGLGLDYVFQAFAPTIIWLFVGRIIAGFFGASYTTAKAFIADISEPEKRAQNFGLIGAAFGLGFIIGPVLGSISFKWGLRTPFYLAAALSMINLIYGYFVLPESLPKENRRKFEIKRANPVGSLKQLRKYPAISGLFVSIGLIFLAAQGMETSWPYYTMFKFSWSAKLVGYSMGFVGFLVALVQGGLIRKAIPKFGHKNSVIIGLVFNVVGLILFIFATKGWMMFAFVIPYCLGGIASPAIQGIMSAQVSASQQGELQGVITSLRGLSAVIGPPLMNGLFYNFTRNSSSFKFPGIPFLIAAILIGLSILFSRRSFSTFQFSMNENKNRPLHEKD